MHCSEALRKYWPGCHWKGDNEHWEEGHPDLLLPECNPPDALRYPVEVTDPSRFAEIKDLPEPSKEELALFKKVIDKLTEDLDLNVFHYGNKERIEAMVKSEMKGEVTKVVKKKPKKPVAKSMMKTPKAAAESLK